MESTILVVQNVVGGDMIGNILTLLKASPYKALGLLFIVLGIFWYINHVLDAQYDKGYDAGKNYNAKELADLTSKLSTMQRDNEEYKSVSIARISKLSTELQEKQNEIQRRKADISNRIDNKSLGLYIPSTCTTKSVYTTDGKVTTTAEQSLTETKSRLDDNTSKLLVELTSRGDSAIVQSNECATALQELHTLFNKVCTAP